MKSLLKGFCLGAILICSPVVASVGDSNHVYAFPPEQSVYIQEKFNVPKEFIGDFSLTENLIDTYNSAVGISAYDTDSLSEWRQNMYSAINQTYNDDMDKCRALCLFYASSHSYMPAMLKRYGVKDINSLEVLSEKFSIKQLLFPCATSFSLHKFSCKDFPHFSFIPGLEDGVLVMHGKAYLTYKWQTKHSENENNIPLNIFL